MGDGGQRAVAGGVPGGGDLGADAGGCGVAGGAAPGDRDRLGRAVVFNAVFNRPPVGQRGKIDQIRVNTGLYGPAVYGARVRRR